MTFGKKTAVIVLSAVLVFVVIDFVSAYFLFFYQMAFGGKDVWESGTKRPVAYSDGVTPSLSAVNTLIDRIKEISRQRVNPASEQPRISGAPPAVLFRRNEEFGWVANPGVYRFVFGGLRDKQLDKPLYHDWQATILPDGSRATSRHPIAREHQILVFGDSWLFGWALDEELTMAWHLQSEFRDRFSVKLYAQGGYGHLQALANFHKYKNKVGKGDILIFGYAQWLLPRNLPSPSVVVSLAEGLKKYADGPGKPLMYPRAIISGNRVRLEPLPLDCEMARDYCNRKEPTLDELFDVTNKIFDEIIDDTKARVLVLLMDGPEDKVIEHLRKRGVTVVDGRQPRDFFARDTLEPYDAHPGPISNHYWFTQLRKEIEGRQ